MPPTVHNFQRSLSFGKQAEQQLDTIFSKWYQIEEVSLADEKKLGIDRIFTKPNGQTLRVEYKADRLALKTGNIFIELEVNGKPGWTRKTVADVIIYAFADKENILQSAIILTQELIQTLLPTWEQLPKKNIINNGFTGIGVLVKIESLASTSKFLTFN